MVSEHVIHAVGLTGFETVIHHRPKDGLALEAHLRPCEPVSLFSNMAGQNRDHVQVDESGSTSVSPAKRSRACSPSVPSSPVATANTLASTSITFCPNVIEAALKVTRPPPRADTVENLIHTSTR